MTPSSSLSTELSKRAVWIWLVVILAVTSLTYAATLRFGYVYDDVLQIRDNPRIRSIDYLPGYFTHQVWAQAQNQPENLYRPLFLTWLLANFEAFGNSPWGWHFTTVALHLFVTWLVFLLARRLIPDDGTGALVSAAVFALHLLRVESVAWVSAVTEALAAAFVVSAVLCYIHYRDSNKTGWMAASLFLYAGAMLAKESAIVLPVLIVAYEVCFRENLERPSSPSRLETSQLRRLAAALLPYAFVAGVYLAIRAVVLHGFAHQVSDVPRWTSILTWPWAIYFYLSQSIAPAGLGPFYDVEFAPSAPLTLLVVPIVALSAMAVGLWWWSRKASSKLPLFGGAWFIVTLAPALAVFTLMSRYENVHDRYLYLPSVGFSILVGFAWTVIAQRFGARTRIWEVAVAVALLAGLAVMSHRQSLYWENDEALFTRGVAVAPHNVLAKLNLASELVRQQRFEGAFAISQQAVDLNANSLTLSSAAQAAYYLGDYARTEAYYERALALGEPRVDQLYYLGLAQVAEGKYQEGVATLRKGLAMWPDSPGYHAGIGRALADTGNWTGARDEYKLELMIYPGSPGAREALANAEAHLQPEPAKPFVAQH